MNQNVPILDKSNAITLAVSGAEVSKQQQVFLLDTFNPFFTQAKEWFDKAEELKVTDVSQTDRMKLAREARLALKKIRTTTDAKRKELKSDYLKTGQAIDKIAKVVKDHIKPIEDFLQEQEDFVKNLEARLHEERLDILHQYKKYVDISYKNLGKLSQERFDEIHQETKEAFEYTKTQERLAEEKQLAEEKAKKEEDNRIREENKKLKEDKRKIELEALREKERAAKEQRAKLEAQQKLEKLEQDKKKAEARKLQEIQERFEREKVLKERERLIIEREQKLELKEIIEEEFSEQVLEDVISLESDEDKLKAVLEALKAISISELNNKDAAKLWKKTSLQIKTAIKGLERGIKSL